jgi:hypothetical protein
MHHHNQHDKVRLVGVVTISMLVGLLAAGRRASAQSLDSSAAGMTNASSDDRTIPPDVKSLTIDTPDLPSASDEATTANDVDDSAAPPMGEDPDVEDAPSANAVGSDEASGSASENGAVLEIPQVVNLPNGGSANVPADEASANPESNDDDTALSSQDDDEDDTGGESDLTEAGSPVGTLADYQNQASEAPPGAIFFAPPVAVVAIPRPPLFNPLLRPPLGTPMVAAPIILPPTSPMLMAPRPGTFGPFPRFGSFPRVGSFPRGGLMGARR